MSNCFLMFIPVGDIKCVNDTFIDKYSSNRMFQQPAEKILSTLLKIWEISITIGVIPIKKIVSYANQNSQNQSDPVKRPVATCDINF